MSSFLFVFSTSRFRHFNDVINNSKKCFEHDEIPFEVYITENKSHI